MTLREQDDNRQRQIRERMSEHGEWLGNLIKNSNQKDLTCINQLVLERSKVKSTLMSAVEKINGLIDTHDTKTVMKVHEILSEHFYEYLE